MTTPYENIKKQWEQDPQFKKHYKKLRPEFNLSRALIEARMKAHLSQKQVDTKMKTTQSVISRLEGGNQNVSLKTLLRYAQAVGQKIKPEINPQTSN